jgi:hypothetical protein
MAEFDDVKLDLKVLLADRKIDMDISSCVGGGGGMDGIGVGKTWVSEDRIRDFSHFMSRK